MAVRKRAVRAEKKKRRLFLSALFVLLLIAALAVVFYVNREPEIPVLDRPTDPSVTFVQRATEEIASVTVENDEGTYTLKQENGVVSMLGREDFVFSENMLTPLLDSAAYVYAVEKIMDIPDSGYQFRDFGLEDDCIRVSVSYTDGASVTFRIGDLIPQETPQYYLRVEGDNGLYAASMDVQEIFMLSADALHAVTDPALKGDLIDRIAFTGENAFTMALEGAQWYLTAPFRYPLSAAKVNQMLSKIENIRFAQYVSRADTADLTAYDLSPARRTVTLTIAESILTGYDESDQPIASQTLPGYDLAFHCGKDQSDVLFYCLYRDDVVLATRFSANVLLSQTYDTLLTDTPFAVSLSELTRLEWETAGQTRAWDISLVERLLPNNEFERDESGNILHDVVVSVSGAAFDSDSFILFYSRLVDVKTTHPLPADYELPADCAVTIRLFTANDVREIKLHPYGDLHYALSINGRAVHYLSRDTIDSLQLP
ncbi:MAG: DUF4340 domain-containing protein [Clostridia bacterium]|nr:DUF4340 domain-containing protein [Clostridia bacterium]